MACGGRRTKSEPVQISVTPRPQIVAPKVRKIEEFRCNDCGYIGLSPKHVCKPKTPAWIVSREKKCGRCQYNDQGRTRDDGQPICLLTKSSHPERDAIISVGVGLDYAYCEMGMWERVQFRCPNCESVTYNENGTSRCKQCGFGERKCSLPPIFNVIDEPPLEGPSDLAIVTVAVGQRAFELLEITRPMLERYATKCGADLHVITDDAYSFYPIGNKFRLAWLTEKYKRVCYIDNDVWIRESAPNLFEVVPSGTVGIYEDYPFTKDRELFDKESDRIAKQQQVERIQITMLNTGVVVFDNEHRSIWMPPPLPAPTTHLTEQSWVEYQIRRDNVPTTLLDQSMNCQWWHGNFQYAEPAAHIVHLAACSHDERVYRLRKYAQRLSQ